MATVARNLPSDYALLASTQKYVIRMLRRRGAPLEWQAAWNEFYCTYDPLIRRFARICGVSERGMDDALQNAWVAVFKGLPSFECTPDRGPFRAWLYVQVRRTVVDQFRRDARCFEYATGVNFEKLPGHEPQPQQVFESRWNKVILLQALAVFERSETKENFQLFYLRKFRELSVAELAQGAGLSEVAVRQRVRRASHAFHRLLKESGLLDLMFADPVG